MYPCELWTTVRLKLSCRSLEDVSRRGLNNGTDSVCWSRFSSISHSDRVRAELSQSDNWSHVDNLPRGSFQGKKISLRAAYFVGGGRKYINFMPPEYENRNVSSVAAMIANCFTLMRICGRSSGSAWYLLLCERIFYLPLVLRLQSCVPFLQTSTRWSDRAFIWISSMAARKQVKAFSAVPHEWKDSPQIWSPKYKSRLEHYDDTLWY